MIFCVLYHVIMNLVLAHEILNVFWMIWDTLLAEEAAAVACDENVVLDTDSTEILVCLQLFIVDEVLVETLSAPFVDEGWDEVDSRFVCNNEAFFKSAAHAQAVCSELLQIRSCFIVKAHVGLSESLHVVYVHTHHVAQSVRQEHGVSASPYSLLRIAHHESELLQSVCHKAANVHVHVEILDARL